MMISPDMFYKLYLKGKDIKETLTIIKGLRITIGKLKNKLENPFEEKIFMAPSPRVQLSCNCDYLERSILYLYELGYKYKPTKKELKSEEFNSHLCRVKKNYFRILWL